MSVLLRVYRIFCQVFINLLVFLFFQNNAHAFEKVVGVGDSITAGWPYVTEFQDGSRVGGYEPSLENMLVNSGQQAVVLNYGHPGEMSGDGNDRIQWILDKEKPAVVLVMDGTNDLFWVDTSTVLTNLKSMVNKVIQSGATPVLATISPDTRLPPMKPIPEMNDKIRNWAMDNNVKLADQYAALINNWNQLNCGDELHPNQAGYAVMAQTWFTAINVKPVIIGPIILFLLNK